MRIEMSDAVLLVALALMFVISGTMSFEDEVNRIDGYCEMVRSNIWPDYDSTINCEEENSYE